MTVSSVAAPLSAPSPVPASASEEPEAAASESAETPESEASMVTVGACGRNISVAAVPTMVVARTMGERRMSFSREWWTKSVQKAKVSRWMARIGTPAPAAAATMESVKGSGPQM